MVVPFNFRQICLKLGVELEMENKKKIDDRLCVCLAKLNILIELVRCEAGWRSRDDHSYCNASGKRICVNVYLSNGQRSDQEFDRGTPSDRFLCSGYRQNHGQNCSRNTQANGK